MRVYLHYCMACREWMQLCLDNLAGALNHTLAQRASIQARADPHVRRAIVWSDRGTAAAATRSLWALKRMHVVVPVLKDKLTQVRTTAMQSSDNNPMRMQTQRCVLECKAHASEVSMDADVRMDAEV